MKIQLLRGGALAKEVEFTANLPPLEINRLAVDLIFENFERNETYLWPNEEDMRGALPKFRSLRTMATFSRQSTLEKSQKRPG